MNATEKQHIAQIAKKLTSMELHVSALIQICQVNERMLKDKDQEIKKLRALHGLFLN